MIEITRRSALLGAIASFFMPKLPLASDVVETTPNVTSYINAINSFPKITLPNSVPNNAFMTFFMKTNAREGEEYPAFSIEIYKKAVQIDEDAKFSDIEALLENVESIDLDHLQELRPQIMRLANAIAKETRRAAGNHVTFIDTGILIWYQGSSQFDAPFQVIEGTEQILAQDTAHQYFRKINIDYSKFKIEDVKSELELLTAGFQNIKLV